MLRLGTLDNGRRDFYEDQIPELFGAAASLKLVRIGIGPEAMTSAGSVYLVGMMILGIKCRYDRVTSL